MKLRVDRDALTDAVSWASRSLPSRPPTPLLAGLRLSASEVGTLSLSAFDYEVSAQLSCPAEVIEAGDALVGGKLLSDICRSLPSRPVDIAVDDTRATVTCGSSRFTLPAMPVQEYPELPNMPEVAGMIAGDVFADAVSQVATAASKDDTLPILTGVRMEIEGDKLTLIATDRYRLALRELPWRNAGSPESAVALVRSRTLQEAAKSLGSSGQDVTVALSEDGASRLIGFASGGRKTTSLLLDGDYPKVRALFPNDVPIFAVVDRQVLLEAVRRVSLVADRNVSVRLTFDGENVTLEAGQTDEAQASERVSAHLVGEPISVAFNPAFLIDGLSAMHEAFVRLSFTQPVKPAVLTAQKEMDGPDDVSFRYLLMPVRLSS